MRASPLDPRPWICGILTRGGARWSVAFTGIAPGHIVFVAKECETRETSVRSVCSVLYRSEIETGSLWPFELTRARTEASLDECLKGLDPRYRLGTP